MAVISVEVPDEIAIKFNPYMVISSYDLYEQLDNDWENVVDFGKNGISKKEWDKYLDTKN